MKAVAIVQARMGSTRLPGKVLMDIGGRTMLERVVERARRAELLQEVVVATTVEPADDALADLATQKGWAVFRGSQDDVLERYEQAARRFDARVIVRITSDCPLIDPGVVDDVVRALTRSGADYCSNCLRRTFPRGLDVEAMTRDSLEIMAEEATLPHEREHVTPFLYGRPDRFRLQGVEGREDHSAHRWTVDTPEDLQLLRSIFAAFGADGPRSWSEVLEVLARRPEIAAINAHVPQKSIAQGPDRGS